MAEPLLPVPAHSEAAAPEAALRFDAVELFCERAEAHSGFTLEAANVPAVAELCRRLDGIPLAMARSRALDPADMLARLKNRFDLLTQGRRTALPRHQTLRAAIDWSYDLLSPAEQTLLRRLSVFPGPFTMESAQVLVLTTELGQLLAFGRRQAVSAAGIDRPASPTPATGARSGRHAGSPREPPRGFGQVEVTGHLPDRAVAAAACLDDLRLELRCERTTAPGLVLCHGFHQWASVPALRA